MRVKHLKREVFDLVCAHPKIIMVAIAFAVVLMGTALLWFTAFSDMNEPVQFVYDSF